MPGLRRERFSAKKKIIDHLRAADQSLKEAANIVELPNVIHNQIAMASQRVGRVIDKLELRKNDFR